MGAERDCRARLRAWTGKVCRRAGAWWWCPRGAHRVPMVVLMGCPWWYPWCHTAALLCLQRAPSPQAQGQGRDPQARPRLLCTSQPQAQLPGEKDERQLALAVGGLGVVLPPLPVQVLQVHVPGDVGQGREVDDARRRRGLQLVQQQVRQKKVT